MIYKEENIYYCWQKNILVRAEYDSVFWFKGKFELFLLFLICEWLDIKVKAEVKTEVNGFNSRQEVIISPKEANADFSKDLLTLVKHPWVKDLALANVNFVNKFCLALLCRNVPSFCTWVSWATFDSLGLDSPLISMHCSFPVLHLL